MVGQERDPEAPVERPNFWLPPPLAGLTPAPTRATGQPQPPPQPGPHPRAQPGVPTPRPTHRPRPTPHRSIPRPFTWSRSTLGWRSTTSRRDRRTLAGILALLVLPLIVLPALFNAFLGSDASTRSSPPTPTTAPRTAEVVWSTTVRDLRPDLEEAQLETSLDGASDDSLPSAAADVWLAITARPAGSDTVLHAIDPATGKVEWERRLDGVLCATEAPKSGILCASVLGRDPTTGLGTQWRLHLIDPATGKDRLTRDISGWLTAVHRAGQSFRVVGAAPALAARGGPRVPRRRPATALDP